jgi:B-box zinc finger protein
MKCAAHPDRAALGYCSRCGRPLCKDCLVRLNTGNFCEACANNPEGVKPRAARRIPWWVIVVVVLGIVVLLRLVVR